jgi:hypothetical protein
MPAFRSRSWLRNCRCSGNPARRRFCCTAIAIRNRWDCACGDWPARENPGCQILDLRRRLLRHGRLVRLFEGPLRRLTRHRRAKAFPAGPRQCFSERSSRLDERTRHIPARPPGAFIGFRRAAIPHVPAFSAASGSQCPCVSLWSEPGRDPVRATAEQFARCRRGPVLQPALNRLVWLRSAPKIAASGTRGPRRRTTT